MGEGIVKAIIRTSLEGVNGILDEHLIPLKAERAPCEKAGRLATEGLKNSY